MCKIAVGSEGRENRGCDTELVKIPNLKRLRIFPYLFFPRCHDGTVEQKASWTLSRHVSRIFGSKWIGTKTPWSISTHGNDHTNMFGRIPSHWLVLCCGARRISDQRNFVLRQSEEPPTWNSLSPNHNYYAFNTQARVKKNQIVAFSKSTYQTLSKKDPCTTCEMAFCCLVQRALVTNHRRHTTHPSNTSGNTSFARTERASHYICTNYLQIKSVRHRICRSGFAFPDLLFSDSVPCVLCHPTSWIMVARIVWQM